MSRLVVPQSGSLEATGDLFEQYQLVDADGVVVAPAGAYFRDLAAGGRAAATQRSYGMALLRWWRFIRAVEIGWDQATRAEARDFLCWVQLGDKPERPHWRYPGGGAPGTTAAMAPGTPNPVTGKRSPGRGYATATVVHCESVLRAFYDFHLEAGTGPMVNPFPLARGRRGRANAHHNPMQPVAAGRAGRYRPKMARRIPRQIPDEKFGELFARLGSHRDRALVAFWVSTGARASELLGATAGDADPGQQLITVIRKGTRALQQLPASPDAFVWLRLYQAEMDGLVPAGRDQPLWWTLRRPFRALAYDAARVMFTRANAALGANWTLHDLRHSAAYRMARDPAVPLSDLQWVMGHARLSTTQRYLNPLPGDAVEAVLAFHARQARQDGVPVLSPGYRAESLQALFGEDAR
ncbi:MAG: site-specific integrase [Streptosporangiaceae bacterium]